MSSAALAKKVFASFDLSKSRRAIGQIIYAPFRWLPRCRYRGAPEQLYVLRSKLKCAPVVLDPGPIGRKRRNGEKIYREEVLHASHFAESIRTALWENAKEISVTVAGIRAAGVISPGLLAGSA